MGPGTGGSCGSAGQGRAAAFRHCTASVPAGAQCGGGQVFQECSSPCGRTCADLRLDGAGSCPDLDGLCVSGCNCPEGLVLDDSGQCVPKDVCPCQHGGELYPPGSKIRQGCNAWCVPRGPWALSPQGWDDPRLRCHWGGDGLLQGTAVGTWWQQGPDRGRMLLEV